jgi:ABC-type transport system substrate-binding protein
MDRLLDTMAKETDNHKRRSVFKQVVQRASDKAYWLPNNQEIIASAWSNRLKNFKPWNYFQAEHAFAETWVED